MIARFSKCDFWNLWKIWDRNRYSKKNWSKTFSSKKIRKLLVEKIFGTTIFRFFVEKKSLKKSMKIQNFEISGENRKIFEISKFLNFHWFFQRKKVRTKIDFFGPKMFFDQKFSDFFRRNIFRHKISGSPISIPNDPKITKITLRTACDHYKNTNNARDKKVTIIFLYLTSDPSWEDEVREPSVHDIVRSVGLSPLFSFDPRNVFFLSEEFR